jgi:ubiquinone/menaquinone biosynthesis C-methylase UbiE
MKVRDSGMPSEDLWATFFDVEIILERMQVNNTVNNLMEVGCGYGTFTIDASKKITGQLFAFDIEQQMIDYTKNKIDQEGLTNIEFFNHDIIESGSGIKSGWVDYVMLFNILHHEKPLELLSVAHRVLNVNGKVGIIHWRTDIETPRGPDISIRPRPEQCVEWAKQAGFSIYKLPEILEPYHYGLIIEKP